MLTPPQTNLSPCATTEDRWFLRIDEKIVGPITRAQLETFLRPPRLCQRMDVMCSLQPERWHCIKSTQILDDVLALAGLEKAVARQTLKLVPRFSLFENLGSCWDGIAAGVLEYRGLIGIAFLLVAANLVAWVLSQNPDSREREILATYESISEKMREYREGRWANEDWKRFALESLQVVEPMIAELKRTSNVHHPVRQNLLYAGQDSLTSLLKSGEPPADKDQSALVFERYIEIVREQLLIPPKRNAAKDPAMQ